jgi:hypothetical protein
MSYDLIFLLEEPSMKTVLETILPKLIPEHITYICIAHQGKQDLTAVEKAYGLNPESLSKKQNQNKFRDPDRLNSAKEELKKLVSEYYPGTHSSEIAPYLSLTENKSRSFQVFIDGIKKIISNCA